MPWLAALAVGLALGAGIGHATAWIPVPAIARSVTAGLAALAGAAGTMAGIWYVELRRLENAFFSVGLEEDATLGAMAWLGGLGAGFALLHLALVRIGRWKPAVAVRATVVVGCTGGLLGALPVAWAMVVFRGLLQP